MQVIRSVLKYFFHFFILTLILPIPNLFAHERFSTDERSALIYSIREMMPGIQQECRETNDNEHAQLLEKLNYCHEQLKRFNDEEIIEDLIALLPTIITYFQTRAPRLDAQEGVNGAISGCQASCIGSLEIIPKLQQILTLLIQCCATIDSEFQETWTILGAGFNGTFTSLSDIKNTLTACCASIKTDVQGVFTALGICGPIIPITAPTTITIPGNYCLANDIIGSVVIDSDNVYFDLNGHEISATTTGIVVTDNRENIKIINGIIRNGLNASGIRINFASQNVLIDSIIIINDVGGSVGGILSSGQVEIINVTIKDGILSQAAIRSNSSSVPALGAKIVNSLITNISFTNNADAISVTGPHSIIDVQVSNNTDLRTCISATGLASLLIKNCIIQNNFFNNLGGFVILIVSDNVLVQDCLIEENRTVYTTCYGIYALSFNTLNIQNCIIKKNQTTNIAGIARGIFIDSTLGDSVVIDSNTILSNTSPNINNFGIFLSGNNPGTYTFIRNVCEGQATNYSITPLPPIITYDISANTVTPLPATVTPYHNLSVVP